MERNLLNDIFKIYKIEENIFSKDYCESLSNYDSAGNIKKLDELLVEISSKTYINIIEQNKEIIRIEDAVSKIITYINKHHSQI